ncbi:Caspase domain-containing protein [Calothrix sp. 336/3]|nr:Caspase domain-containing protein [Calothrix sp. 336/3]
MKVKQVLATPKTCQRSHSSPNFLVVGGGGAPSYNEIALEKNVLYFQRTLRFMGYNPQLAAIFFANGNDGQATIRYINAQRQQQFKAPEIPNLQGASTLENIQKYFQQASQQKDKKPLFFYFTGHGEYNKQDLNNNSFYLWQGKELSVKQFAQILDKMPTEKPVVTMMAQCFSGSFANFIYEGGDPKKAIALQTRCGFFATIKSLPSVGCTPEVNEADYRDYSSSFFAGLSGRDRTGKAVISADFNKDGKVSYAEAHGFAKVDEKTMDLPISTSESWLQNQATEPEQLAILKQPINQTLQTSRPEQRYVVASITRKFAFSPQKSFMDNIQTLQKRQTDNHVESAYLGRLAMELINIGTEKQIRTTKNPKNVTILNKLLKCEAGFWNK